MVLGLAQFQCSRGHRGVGAFVGLIPVFQGLLKHWALCGDVVGSTWVFHSLSKHWGICGVAAGSIMAFHSSRLLYIVC